LILFAPISPTPLMAQALSVSFGASRRVALGQILGVLCARHHWLRAAVHRIGGRPRISKFSVLRVGITQRMCSFAKQTPNLCRSVLNRDSIFLGVLVFAIVYLAACSKSEPPTRANTTPPAPIIAPAPPPEAVVTQPQAPEPTVEQHIPGTPEAKAFIAANVVKQHKRRATNLVPVPATAYDRAYRNASRADTLLQRHAYVLSFDDVAATNAVPLSREYR
jgi:hypothetical protein